MNMKKILFLLSAWCLALSGHAADTDYIYAKDATVAAGQQCVLSVHMKNSEPIAGFQFRTILPEGMTFVTDADDLYKAYLSEERTTSRKTDYFNSALQSDGSLMVLCSSTGADPNTGQLYAFAGNDGEVCTITIHVPESCAPGNYVVQLADIVMTIPTAEYDFKTERTECTLTVTEPEDPWVTLDENATTLPQPSEGETEIVVKRTLKANEWSSICLPFAMTAEQVYEVFGEDVMLAEFLEYEANDDLTAIDVIFDLALLEEDGFMANYPYVIKTSKDISEFKVASVVEPDEEGAVAEFTNGRTGSRKEVYGTFYGTLHAGDKVPANCIFLHDNEFWYSVGKTTIKGFRGYFEFVDVLEKMNDVSQVKFNFYLNDETTGIGGAKLDIATDDVVYDLSGRRVTRIVQKGIYVVNGKKVLK